MKRVDKRKTTTSSQSDEKKMKEEDKENDKEKKELLARKQRNSRTFFISSVPELSVWEPHPINVWDLKELEDGNIATCSDDATIRIWSRSSGACLSMYKHSHRAWRFVEWNQESREGEETKLRLVLGDDQGYLFTLNRVVDDNNTRQICLERRFETGDRHEEGIVSIIRLHNNNVINNNSHSNNSQSRSVTLIATGSYDSRIKVWRLEDGTCLQMLEGHTGSVRALSETRDGAILSGSRDRTIKVWRLKGKTTNNNSSSSSSIIENNDSGIHEYELECTLHGHTGWIGAVIELSSKNSPKEEQKWGIIASSSIDCSVRLWDRKSQACLSVMNHHEHEVPTLVEMEPGVFVSGSKDGTLRVWNETGRCLNKVMVHPTAQIWRVSLMRDGSLLVGESKNKSFHIVETWIRFLISSSSNLLKRLISTFESQQEEAVADGQVLL